MNKRSAMLIAAGLVLTLGIGGLAVSLGLTGPTPAGAADTALAQRVVEVQARTVTAWGTVDSDDAGEEDQEHEGEDHGTFEVDDD